MIQAWLKKGGKNCLEKNIVGENTGSTKLSGDLFDLISANKRLDKMRDDNQSAAIKG